MATNDVFGYKRNPKATGVFSSEDSSLIITGGDGAGGSMAKKAYLVQNWGITYSQSVVELFEIGSPNLYWAKGRPAGAGRIGRIIGGADPDTPNGGIMPSDAYDLCSGGAEMIIKAVGGHCDTAPTDGGIVLNRGVRLKMSGVAVTSLGFSMNVADVRLMESYDFRFAYLEMKAAT